MYKLVNKRQEVTAKLIMAQIREFSMSREKVKSTYLVWSNVGRKIALSDNKDFDSTLETLKQELKGQKAGQSCLED